MNPFADLLRNLGPIRIAALIGTAVAVLGFFIFLATRLSSGGMTLLYGDLDIADSGSIIQKLDEQKILYDIKAGGKQIYVPSDQVLRVRVTLAESGLPGGGSMGYEIFDKNQSLGTTNFVQNVNLVRALEGELSRTISSMRNVRGTRVHLVLPQRELFSRERRKPSASVVLQMIGAGRLGKEQVLAIQHLVAAAVPEMNPEHIAILDDRGQLLARGFGDNESAALTAQNNDELRTGLENRMRRSIVEIVERVVGLDRVRAEITAEVDYDRITENEEKFDPDTQVARSTQTIEDKESNSEKDKSSSVSVENNLPESEVANDTGGTASASESARTEETINFEISRIVTNRTKEGGEVKRLSVAVLVDGRYAENNDGDMAYQPRTTEELEKIDKLVKSAVGYNADRGDTVEIINMQFVKLEPLDLSDGSMLFGISKEEFLQLAEVLVLAVVGLLVILLVVRPVLTRLFESMPTTFASGAAALGAGTAENALAQLTGPDPGADIGDLLEAEEEDDSLLDQMIDIQQVEGRVRASSLKKIGEIVDKHPEEAVAIIRTWMYQETGT